MSWHNLISSDDWSNATTHYHEYQVAITIRHASPLPRERHAALAPPRASLSAPPTTPPLVMSAFLSALARPGAAASLGRGGKLGARSVGRSVRAWGGHAGCRSRASPGVRCVGTEVRVTHPWPRHAPAPHALNDQWLPGYPYPSLPAWRSRARNISSSPTTRDLNNCVGI